MFNLIVGPCKLNRSEETIVVPRSRFLESTDEAIEIQLTTLSNEAIDCLKSWPCIVMREGRGEEIAAIGKIMAVEAGSSEVQVKLRVFRLTPELINAALWNVRDELGIGQFEFNRNHWAIKDRNLIQELASAELAVGGLDPALFSNMPLPAPSRAELMAVKPPLEVMSHDDLDDLLLEAGVSALQAGRDKGSRRSRAHAIVQYAIVNPSTVTAENSLFSAFIVRKASANSSSAPQVGSPPPRAPVQTFVEPLSEASRQPSSSGATASNRVFIVHGRNEDARTSVVEFLAEVGLKGIVLHEQPSMGRHLLTKFIQEAELATFAVVLMTDDDIGGAAGGAQKSRARQNVILELGYFIAQFGQARVCALITPELETPSDFDGIVYIPLDPGGNWKGTLKRELRAAKMPLTAS